MNPIPSALSLVVAAFAFLACADRPETPLLRAEPARPSTARSARAEVRAPIVRVAVRTAESFPPQYFADITSALPDGCAQFSRADLRRAGDTLIVDVFNTRPVGDEIACTMLYGERETAIVLGSEFVPGTTYSVDVNGTQATFVAQ